MNYEKNRFAFAHVGISQYHQAGFTGKRTKILVFDDDFPIQDTHLKNIVIPISASMGKNYFTRNGRPSDHGLLTCDILHQVAPGAEIYFCRSTAGIAFGLNWAIKNNMDIFSLSMGYDWNNFSVREMAQQAAATKLILNTSAGNDAAKGLTNPARKPEFISIGAGFVNLMTGRYERASYSSIGPELDFMALTGRYAQGRTGSVQYRGTSCSCPIFSGMTALYFERNGKIEGTEKYKDFVKENCLDVYLPGKDDKTGYGFFKLPSLKNNKTLKEIILFIDRNFASVDGNIVSIDQSPYIVPETSRTVVPISFIGRTLKHKVDWNEQTRQVIIDDYIVLTIGSKEVKIGDEIAIIDQEPFIDRVSWRTMVPLSFVARELNYHVYWNGIARSIAITT